MQLALTRQEIRRQMRAHLGQTMVEASAAHTAERYNVFIDSAALKVQADCAWLSAQQRVTLDLTSEQYKLAYPANAAVGSVTEVALYESGASAYVPLRARDLNLLYDFDQLEAAGGSAYDAIQGEPRHWQQRGDFIYFYPPNDDTARKVRLRYNLRATFPTDATVSTVDGEAIVFWAASLAFQALQQADEVGAMRALYADRIALMRGWQNTGERVSVDAVSDMANEEEQERPWPNWSREPRV